MGLLENLAEGFGRAAGADEAVSAIEKKKQRRQQLSDLELQTQTQQILGDVASLQERRTKLDKNSPTYAQDLKTIDQALHDARGVFTDLYHPQNNPDALSKLGGFIKSHLGGKKSQAAATPAQARQSLQGRMAGIESAAYAPQSPQNKFAELRRQLKEAMPNISDEDLNRAVLVNAGAEARPRALNPSWKLYISPDGKQRDYYDVNDKESIPKGWMPVASRGEQNPPKVGSFGDFMIQAYGPHPTPEQYEEGRGLWAKSGAATTVGEHVVMVPQKDGTILPVTVVTTSTKQFPNTGQGQGRTMIGNPTGLRVPGNMNLDNRQVITNPAGTKGPFGEELEAGSVSTETSISFGTDQGEVLVTTVWDGKHHTAEEAMQHYRETGQHMGIFDTPEHADAYAKTVHERQDSRYNQIPSTPAQARSRLSRFSGNKAPSAGVASVGAPVGGRLTSDQVSAKKNYEAAVGLMKVADLVSQKPKDAVNQKRLAVALERQAAGRFTTQALDYVMKAGWGNTIEQWANGPTTGALPPDIVRQLVDGARENLQGAKASLDTAMGATSTPASITGDSDVDAIIRALNPKK